MTGQVYVTMAGTTAPLPASASGFFGRTAALFSRTGTTLWRLRYAFALSGTLALAYGYGATADDNTEINMELRHRALDRLSSPDIYIEGMKRRQAVNGTAPAEMPAVLQTEDGQKALANRLGVPIYSHNPSWGDSSAGVTIIEFSDLSCVDCTSHFKLLSDLKTRYGDQVRWVHKHLPQNPYQATNLTAFYGKIAQRAGVFWDYRHHLTGAKNRSESTLMDALAKAGVDLRTIQHDTRLYARDIYRELDTDVQLGLRQRMSKPPYLFVNGIFMTENMPVESLEDIVRYELEQKKRPTPNSLQARGAQR